MDGTLTVTLPKVPHRDRPRFFEEIAARSAKRWDQLEADPELAAPWHQLFKQVQSPRHVLSELLQNAEDVGATWARCSITDNLFTFEHDGTDFDEASLASLCRFGYSSKRTLHTIGFRGIGFKTTFSLGPVVTVETPTLAFRFHRERYTLPLWMDAADAISHTRVCVAVEDPNRRAALEENLEDWLHSPAPILFFSNIKSLEINGTLVTKTDVGDGPVPHSRWLLLQGEQSTRILKISAKPEKFPKEAVEEIRNERGDGDFEPGDCSLDLIFGLAENRLYTVLPTQVMPNLPFSCNAPFVQEPSRVRIQDPAQSPTNRWLLERAGRLASQSLQAWIRNEKLAIGLRVSGYKLLPSKESSPLTQLDAAVRRLVCQEIKADLDAASCVICHSDQLYCKEECANIPADFVEAWGAETALNILGNGQRNCINPNIPEVARKNLADWGLLEARDDSFLRDRLKSKESLPRPSQDSGLFQLWAAIEKLNAAIPKWYSREAFTYPVVPAINSDCLSRPRDICRAIGHDENLDKSDHEYLSRLVKIADSAVLQRLDTQTSEQENADANLDPKTYERLPLAVSLFRRFTIEAWSLQRVFDTACRTVFASNFDMKVGFHLTQIAFKANLSALEGNLAFLCSDGLWRFGKNYLIFSLGLYDDLLPDSWLQEFSLSSSYWTVFPEDEHKRFQDWLRSNRSGLEEFPSPQRITTELSTPTKVRAEVLRRGGSQPDFSGSGNTRAFSVQDYDWSRELISFWEEAAREDAGLWTRLVAACAQTWGAKAQYFAVARIDRPRGAARFPVSEGLTSAWLLRLQSLPCLPEDKFNQPEMPYNLLYRTPETEPLLNIEKFVHRSLDTTQTRDLLELLGVRSQPRSAEKLMIRLLALSEAEKPPLTHVSDLYRALDGVFDLLDTKNRAAIHEQFQEAALILDQEGIWRHQAEIYQANEEELPGIAIIHPEMRALSLWDRLGVERSPNMDRVLSWLRGLPSRGEIAASDRRRVAAILGRMPNRAFDETQHWLSRAGTWTPWHELRFFVASTLGDGAGDGVLFPPIRRQIADFRMLTPEQVKMLQGHLLPLGEVLTHLAEATLAHPRDVPEWVQAMAVGFLRAHPIEESDGLPLENAELQDDLQAVDLYYSSFHEAQSLRTVPYLDGVQVGTPVSSRALWQDRVFTVVGADHSYHRNLIEQLERHFVLKGFRQAISDCVGRPASWINGYFEEHFSLRPLAEARRELGLAAKAEPATVMLPAAGVIPAPPLVMDNSSSETEGDGHPSALGAGPIDHADDQDSELDSFEETSESSDQDKDDHRGNSEVDNAQREALELSAHDSRRSLRPAPLSSYLLAHGFVYDDVQRLYSRPDGARVRRETGEEFHQHYNAQGEEQAQYWEYTASVSEGILVPAQIWLYLERKPANCFLVLLGLEGEPLAIPAEALLRWKGQQRLTVSAASYRIHLTGEWVEKWAALANRKE